jgi:hypothetical protein
MNNSFKPWDTALLQDATTTQKTRIGAPEQLQPKVENSTTPCGNNLKYLSSCEPTYWPSDMNKQPDVLDFCVTKGIATQNVSEDSCLELTSDHTPIIVTLHTRVQQQPKKPSLYNKNTDWETFGTVIETQINLKMLLKTEAEVEDAVYNLKTAIQQAAWHATPPLREQHFYRDCPECVKQTKGQTRSPEIMAKLTCTTRQTNLQQDSLGI